MNKNAPKVNRNDQKTTRFILPILTFGTADPLGASARAVLPRRGPQKSAEFGRADPKSCAQKIDLQQFWQVRSAEFGVRSGRPNRRAGAKSTGGRATSATRRGA